MNKIFKVVWSKTKNSYVVVSEIAKRNGKCSSSLNKKLIAAFLAAGTVLSVSGSAWAADPQPLDNKYIKVSDAIGVLDPDPSDPNQPNPEASVVGGPGAIAIGKYAKVSGDANDKADYSVGIGYKTTVTGVRGVALGVNSEITASHAIGIGASALTEGMYATVMGAYSDVSIDTRTDALYNGDALQGFGATVLGSLNSSRTDVSKEENKDKKYISVASSIVGTVNTATDSNGALIFGAGNNITDSYQTVIPDESTMSFDDLRAQYKTAVENGDRAAMAEISAKLQKMVKVSGGQVMAMGGSNKATNAYRSQLVGVGNVLISDNGPSTIPIDGPNGQKYKYYEYKSQYDLLDGFENKVTNSEHVSVIGTGNTVENSNGNIIFGDFHQIKGEAEDENGKKVGGNNVIIGSAAGSFEYVDSETGKLKLSFKASEDTKHEENISNTVMVGHLANAKISEGVALGYSSLANTDKGVQGFDPATGTASELTSKTWKATAAAVSVGNDLKKTWYGFDENTIQTNINKYKKQLEALGVDTTLAPADLLDSLNEEQMQILVDNVAHQTNEAETKPEQEGYLYVAKPGSGITRQITNVAAGFNDTDAVNVAQLKASQTHYYSVNDNGTAMDNYNNDGALGKFSLAAGPDAKAESLLSTVVGTGSYTQDVLAGSLDTIKEAAAYQETHGNGEGHKFFVKVSPIIKKFPSVMGTGSTVLGSMNSVKNRDAVTTAINSFTSTLTSSTAARNTLPQAYNFLRNGDFYDGVANTVVGTMNETEKANISLIYGTGNTIKNAYEELDPTFNGDELATKFASAVSFNKVDENKLQAIIDELDLTNIDELQDAINTGNTDKVKSIVLQYIRNEKGKGGRSIAIGTNNTIDGATLSQVLGTNNSLTGTGSYNKIDGVGNTVSSSTYATVMGSENTVSNTTNTSVIGSKNELDYGQENIIIGDNHTLKGTRTSSGGWFPIYTVKNAANNVILGTMDQENEENKPHQLVNNTVMIGHNADAQKDSAIAIGYGSVVSGANSIAIGTGHSVAGSNSGAFGDPSIINGANSYSVGNNNTIAEGNDNVFALGNNITTVTSNSVFLGDGAAYVESGDSTGGLGEVADAIINGVAYGDFAGTTPVGVVSVGSGSGGKERRIQNVAAGLISSDSTDAINGSQLYTAIDKLQFDIKAGDNITVTTETLNGVKTYTISSSNATTVKPGENVVVEGPKETTDNDNSGADNGTSGNAGTQTDNGNGVSVDKGTYKTDNYTVKAADSKVDSVKVTKGDSTTKGNTTETEYTVTVKSKEQSVKDGEIVTTDVEKSGKFTVTDTRNKIVAGENITVTASGNDEEGPVTYTISAQAATNVKVIDGENTTVTEGKDGDFTTYAVNVKTDGKVASGDKGIVSGDTVYKETRVEKDGNYIKKDNTAADNFVALDEKVKANETNINNITNQFGDMDNRMRKGLAGAAALAALHPMDFNPDDKMQFSAGVGHYRGETAAAIGAFYRPDESVMFSIGGTFGNSDNMINAGITFGLDGTRNRITRSRTAMAREIQDLRSLVTQMAARMDRLEGVNIETAMFPDVPENHWAYEYVEDLQRRGALKGYPDGLFKGDRAMTRYEFAAMLDRLVRSGVTLDSKIAKEFEPELGRIYVERISGQDNDRKKVERVRVNNSDSKYPEGKTRDVYGSKIVTEIPKAAEAK